tara:strand:- start:423 stop:668 length:246 start_codon:yes stop_codon:yes gene_type:complete
VKLPVYSYKCNQCKKIIELLQGFEDSSPLCSCSSGKFVMERLVSEIGRPKFNGSGFYETDYKQNLKKPLESTSGSKGKKNE